MFAIILLIVVLGAALYLIETYIPMAPPIRLVLRIVVVLAIVWYLFRFAGLV